MAAQLVTHYGRSPQTEREIELEFLSLMVKTAKQNGVFIDQKPAELEQLWDRELERAELLTSPPARSTSTSSS